MPDTPEEILKQIAQRTRLGAMPEVMSRLLVMFDDPKSTATQVAEVLGKDAGLVARLLRIANSAYYAGHGNVATVQQALVKLGYRTTKAVVLSSAVYSTINRIAPDDVDLRPFWQHGLEVGITAMLIAEEVCPRLTDECFVAGLLHDIGRVALAMAYPAPFRELLDAPAGHWSRGAEKERFGIDHCQAGAYLCLHWNLPQLLCRAAAEHHDIPESLPESEEGRLPLCVGLANSMARVSWAGPAVARVECREYREAAGAMVGLDAARLQKIEAQVGPQIEEWAELLEIELCRPEDLLVQANQRLYALYEATERLQAENEKLHAQLLADESERAAMEALKVICATFSHHINNATTTILGRAQLVNLALSRKEQDELSEKVSQSMTVIENSVDTITEVLRELKCLTRFDTTSYHGKAEILKLKRDVTAHVESKS